MLTELAQAVRGEVSGTRAHADVVALTRFHRVQSSPGFREAAEWLAGRLREIGLVPEVEEVAGDGRTRGLGVLTQRGWECTGAEAVLVDGAERRRLCRYPEQPLSLVLRSAAASGRFSVVDVGDGAEAADYQGRDVRGRVVLARGPVHRVHALAVKARGAAGILTDTRRLVPPVRTAVDLRDALNYTSFWWAEGEPRGWGLVVTPEEGDRLRARLAEGGALTLEVTIEARDFEIGVPLVSTRIGPAADREVLVLAHLCHPRPSANDNGSGVAAALETARVLQALNASGAWRPRHAVRFLWMPELTGTHAWLERDPARARRLIAALNLDMVGEDQQQCGSTLLIEQPPCFLGDFAADLLGQARAAALDWVTSYSGPGHYSMTRIAEVPYSGGSDHVTLIDPAHGVPCPMLIQWPDRYYHTSHDTPDRVDPGSLAIAARSAATYAGFLVAAGPEALEALCGVVERGARRRLLGARDGRAGAAGAIRERVRGTRALASLGRLGLAAARIESATRAFERFADEHGAWVPTSPSGGPVWRRGVEAPLDFQPHLWPGYERWSEAERERVRTLWSAAWPGSNGIELAWAACDGRRSLAEIAALVALERAEGDALADGTGERSALEEFFRLAERAGLASQVAAERTPAESRP